MKNKNIIITGGLRGIGEILSKYFSDNNFNLIILDNKNCSIKEFKIRNNLNNENKIKIYKCDLSNNKQIDSVVNKIKKNFQNIYLVIHNAIPRFKKLSPEFDCLFNLEIAFKIMICGPTYLTYKIKNELESDGGSSVIFIGSTNSQFISDQSLYYHVCKGALQNTVKYLAVDLGTNNIRVNLVNPGIIMVPGRERKNRERFDLTLKQVIPLQRELLAYELAEFCYLISSDKCKYLSGSSINLDGGEHLKDHFSLLYNSKG